jgi:murein DD-endopeptidase MepM/ murein hydrolase activator NlpD
VCLIASVIAISQLRSSGYASFEDLAELQSEYDLLVEETEQIEKKLSEEKSLGDAAKTALEQKTSEMARQAQIYQKKLDSFSSKAEELKKKIEELSKARDELYEHLNQIPYVPEIENTSVNSSAVAFSNMTLEPDQASQLDEELESIEASLESQSASYNLLSQQFEEVKPVLESYPNIWPVEGPISSRFGLRQNPLGGDGNEFHGGVDIAVASGTTVVATGAGTVKHAGSSGSFGMLVIIDHGMGLETYYGHNSKLLVSVGDAVTRGQAIAESGSTGRSTAPHVHYEVRLGGQSMDPENYLFN